MNKRIYNYILIFILLLLLIISLVKNYHNTEINEYAYVIAIGLDVGVNESLRLTLQIANPSVTASNISSQDENNTTSIIETIECNSINSGLTWFNSYLSKIVNLSHCKALVLSEKLASIGISEYLYTFMNNLQFRKSANIIIAQTTSEDFLENYKPSLEKLSSNYYENIPTTSKYTAYTENITVNDFFNSYIDSFQEPVATLGSLNNKDNIGIAVFNGDKLVGKLDISDTICHLILSNKLSNTKLYIPNIFDENKNMDIYIDNVKKIKKKVKIINGSPYADVYVVLEGELLSSKENINILNSVNIDKIEKYLNQYLEKSFLTYLYKTSKDYKCDIDNFGKYAVKNFITLKNWDNYNWLKQYPNCFFNVKVDFNLRSGQLILDS